MLYRSIFLFLSICCCLTFGAAQETETEQSNPLYESVIFPDRSLSRKIEQADRLFESGRTLEAAQLLGGILESANFAYVMPEKTEDEPTRTLHQTVNDYIIDRIRKLPKEARDSYAFQFEPTAKRLLEDAVAAGSLDEIQQVAQKYYPTSSGAAAAFLVGLTQFERGDYAAAWLTFNKLKQQHVAIPEALNPLLEQLLEESQNNLKNAVEQPMQGISTSSWLEQFGWRIPAGSPSQNSDTESTAPLVEQNWAVPVLNRLPWERETDSLFRSMRSGTDVYIPASQPLVIGDRLITRTPGETIAIDANSGKRLWIAPEQEYRLPESSGLQPQPSRVIHNFRTTLRLFFWHDRISQQLSSDGERIFSVDDHDLQGSYSAGMAFGIPAPRNRAGKVDDLRNDPGNTLTARDLKSGRILWQIGKFPYVQKHFDTHSGQANGDENIFTDDEKTLRETWFLGAPLPLQGQLYVVGESDGVLQLFALESRTGRLVARQALAQTSTSLAVGTVRRTYPLFPSASGGLVVCPTGNGLIVALDATTLSPVWCFSYASVQVSKPAERNPINVPRNQQRIQPGADVNEYTIKQLFSGSGWQVPSMIIDGQRILAAPPDQAALYCLDLLSGKLLWKQSVTRINTLYVAGIHHDKAFLVTPRNLMVIDMNTGNEIMLPDKNFPSSWKPAGVGVRSGNQYFIPFTDGQLAVVDLTAGKLMGLDVSGAVFAPQESQETASTGSPGQYGEDSANPSNVFTPDLASNDVFQEPIQFGNLVGIKGRFFSQSPTQISSFDQKEPLQQRAQALLQADANDPDGLLKQGRILKAEGKLAEAIDAFRSSFAAKPSVEAADFLRKNLLEAVRTDYPSWAHARQELESLAEFPDEWGNILYAEIEGILQSGQTDDLVSVLEKVLAFGQDQSVLIPVNSDHSAQLHRALACLMEQNIAWGNRELKMKWEKIAETFLQQFRRDAGVSSSGLMPSAVGGESFQWIQHPVYLPPEIHRWSLFANVFRHTAAAETSRQILREEYKRHRLPVALDLLEKPSVVSWSELPAPFDWMSGTMDVQNSPAPSDNNSPNVPPAQGDTDRTEIDRHVNHLVAIAKNSSTLRLNESLLPIPFLSPSASALSSFNYVIKQETVDSSFFCCCDFSGKELWRLALPTTIDMGFQNIQRFSGSSGSDYHVYIKGFHHFLLLVHGKSVTAIDATPQSEKVLWSKTLSSVPTCQQNSARTNYSNQRPNANVPFPRNSTFVSPHAVCCWDANCVYGLDPLTGQMLWVRKVTNDHCTILGDAENLFLVFPDIQQVMAIDPVSGRELARGHLPPGGTYIYGTNIVFIEKRGNDHTLSICDLRDIHDKRRRALMMADSPEGNLTPPLPKETLQEGIKNSSMLQMLRNDRFLSVAAWDTRSLQIYDLQTMKKLLPDENKILDFVSDTSVKPNAMRCDVELMGDRILVLFTKNIQIQQPPPNSEEDGKRLRRRYQQIPGVLGLPIDEGVMMLFDSEGHPDPHWTGPGAIYDSEGNRLSESDPDWKPGRPTVIKKVYRLLDVPDRLPVMLFAVGVSERNTGATQDDLCTRIMVVDKRTGDFSFRQELRSDVLPSLQPFRVSADPEAQEITFSTITAPPRTVKLGYTDATVPEE